jgi:hypothetical protein
MLLFACGPSDSMRLFAVTGFACFASSENASKNLRLRSIDQDFCSTPFWAANTAEIISGRGGSPSPVRYTIRRMASLTSGRISSVTCRGVSSSFNPVLDDVSQRASRRGPRGIDRVADRRFLRREMLDAWERRRSLCRPSAQADA